jgi:hypothetical protein
MALLLICSSCAAPATPALARNSVAWLSREFNVPESEVEQVAQIYGVDPANLATFGNGPFPTNLIRQKLEEVRAQNGKITEEDVKRIVRGYVAQCDDGGWYYYFFYSTDITSLGRKPQQPLALVLRLTYDRSSTPRLVEDWTLPTVQDSAFENDRGDLEKKCGMK